MMRRMLLVGVILFVSSGRAIAASAPGQGVVIEAVGKATAAQRAGLAPGDLILSWRRTASGKDRVAQGTIASAFDLADVEVAQAPRGAITLLGRRGGRKQAWSLPPGDWGLKTRPALTKGAMELYLQGKALFEKGQQSDGVARWREAAASLEPASRAWLLLRLAQTLGDGKQWSDADAAYGQAVQVAEDAHLAQAAAQGLGAWAKSLENRNEWDSASERYRKAVSLCEQARPEDLAGALYLDNLGFMARKHGDLKTAEDSHLRALAIREKAAPGSLPVATTLYNLGVVASMRRKDLALAEDYFRRSLAIRTLVPGTSDLAKSLIGLALVSEARGDLIAAEEHLHKALGIQEQMAPDSRDLSITLHNLATVALDRGDLTTAEEYLRRALAIKERVAPDSLSVAGSLHGLADVAVSRGDWASAQQYHTRALTIREKLAPESLDVTFSLNGLADVALGRGDLPVAEDYLRRALAIREKVASESLDVASTLNGLADVALKRGDLTAAEGHLKRALAIEEKLGPGSLDVARTLTALGDVTSIRGDLSAAEVPLVRALDIRRKLAPGSALEAESLHALGVAHVRAHDASAAGYLCHAVDVLEQQKTRLGGTAEARTAFTARYIDCYRECAEALAGQGQVAQAFHVVEQSRARTFLEMLAERDLLFAEDLPPALAKERRLADADYDRTEADLAALSPGQDDEEIDRLLGRLRELHQTQGEIAHKIKRASPRLAALQYPEPLDLAGARGALEPGTTLLAYSVGVAQTQLYVVQASDRPEPGVSVFTLPIGQEGLREKVKAFRSVVQRRHAEDSDVLLTRATDLYDLLVRPAEAIVASSQRLLISPDGPLHTLPFAALVWTDGQGRPSYLVERKPLHLVASATVYAQRKKARESRPLWSVALEAFGDPAVSPDTSLPSPLPYARQEVEDLARLYPGSAKPLLGVEATEESAKAVGKNVRYLHFATHGLLNERFPLDSAIVLASPQSVGQGQNGLLQAWEIFEQVRLDADLVTLSSCETALGAEIGGEGLVGLTRAFEFAGARSVLASLWGVPDKSTADLMRRFYGNLKAGMAKDEALREAQVQMVRSAELPYRWAAFEIFGDWR